MPGSELQTWKGIPLDPGGLPVINDQQQLREFLVLFLPDFPVRSLAELAQTIERTCSARKLTLSEAAKLLVIGWCQFCELNSRR